VTVLIREQDADVVALADAGSRVRVALRNPADKENSKHRSLSLQALFASGSQEE
jgi:Flp pilus assembly protein CpaB